MIMLIQTLAFKCKVILFYFISIMFIFSADNLDYTKLAIKCVIHVKGEEMAKISCIKIEINFFLLICKDKALCIYMKLY